MRIIPISTTVANAFVAQWHRHNGKTSIAGVIACGLMVDKDLIGVAIGGRPVARGADDGLTFEVHRCCVVTDAPKNSCSKLYGAIKRAALALGYTRIITYTLASEKGASVKAAGFVQTDFLKPRSGWACEGRRPRKGLITDMVAKVRWVISLPGEGGE